MSGLATRTRAVVAAVCALTVPLATGCRPQGLAVGSTLARPLPPQSLWPCSIVPQVLRQRLGVVAEPSNPAEGTAQPQPSPLCVFDNAGTTLGFTIAVGDGTPDTTTRVVLPDVGTAFEQSAGPIPGDAAAVGLGVLSFAAGRRHDFWIVFVTCRTGCTQAEALDVAKQVAVAIAPSESQLVGKAPPGSRYWHPGGPLGAVVNTRP